MKHEVSYQVQSDRAAVVEHIRAYLECVGYRGCQEGDAWVFRRGSLLGSMIGFAPVQRQVTVRARVVQTPNRSWKASFVYEINNSLQQVTRPEADFWNCEIDGLEQAVCAAGRCGSEEKETESAGSEAVWAAAVRLAAREAEMTRWNAVDRLVLLPLALIPFILAFCIGIDPLANAARALAAQAGPVTVVGLITAVLLIGTAAGMYCLPGLRGLRAQTPVGLLAGTLGQAAYFGAFGLVIFSGLFLLAAVETRLPVVLLIALSVLGTAAAVDQARRR